MQGMQHLNGNNHLSIDGNRVKISLVACVILDLLLYSSRGIFKSKASINANTYLSSLSRRKFASEFSAQFIKAAFAEIIEASEALLHDPLLVALLQYFACAADHEQTRRS